MGLQHGNKRKIPVNKAPDQLKIQVLKIVKDRYYDFNVTHTQEMLAKHEGIKVSYSLLYSWCREAKLIKRSKRRHAKAHHFMSRLPCEGLMLQMDGSHHAWNGKYPAFWKNSGVGGGQNRSKIKVTESLKGLRLILDLWQFFFCF